jgi:hypothetical protein
VAFVQNLERQIDSKDHLVNNVPEVSPKNGDKREPACLYCNATGRYRLITSDVDKDVTCYRTPASRRGSAFLPAAGYAGGHTPDPTYEDVCTSMDGLNEVVLIALDPDVVNYEQLLKVAWKSHDPPRSMRQGQLRRRAKPHFGVRSSSRQ